MRNQSMDFLIRNPLFASHRKSFAPQGSAKGLSGGGVDRGGSATGEVHAAPKKLSSASSIDLNSSFRRQLSGEKLAEPFQQVETVGSGAAVDNTAMATSPSNEPKSYWIPMLFVKLIWDENSVLNECAVSTPAKQLTADMKLRAVLLACWRYNGRSIAFVIFYVVTTFCMLPLVIYLYFFKFDGFVDAGNTYIACLVNASLTSIEQTQDAVDAFSQAECGGGADEQTFLDLVSFSF